MSNGTERLEAVISGEAPLDYLDEVIRHDGAEWFAEGLRGRLWLIRWFSASGHVSAWPVPARRTQYREQAGSIEDARGEALRIAGMIAEGRKA